MYVSAGHQVLEAVYQAGLDYVKLGELAGISKQAVYKIIHGGKPSPATREAWSRPPVGIDPSWWERQPSPVATEASPLLAQARADYEPPTFALDAPGASRALLLEQLDRVRRERHAAYASRADVATLQRWEKMETDAIKVLGMATGELSRVEEDRLCETSRWLELRDAIVKALAPFPEARLAVLTAMTAHDSKPQKA